tara:strand:- start:85 stop:318 length:234 start_codon:yes stop_codon:yes gene_type:complete
MVLFFAFTSLLFIGFITPSDGGNGHVSQSPILAYRPELLKLVPDSIRNSSEKLRQDISNQLLALELEIKKAGTGGVD